MGQRSLSNRIRSSRVVLNRALAYSTAYLLSWSFFIAGTFFDLSGMEWPTFLWYLSEIFNPLQGFFNFCIFMYPKVKNAKSRGGENMTWFQAFRQAFWSRGSHSTSGSRRRSELPSRRWSLRIALDEHGRPARGRRQSMPPDFRQHAHVLGEDIRRSEVGATI